MTGRIQGVGFRPAVYRLARELGLTGKVFNDTKGVTVELQGAEEGIEEFLRRLQSGPDKPPLAEIQSYRRVDMEPVEGETGFVIEKSDSRGTALSQVTADIATCGDCLSELFTSGGFPVSLSLHQLHQLRAEILDHQDDSLRPPQYDHVLVRDVRAMCGPVPRCDGSAVSRSARRMSAVRPEESG